MDKLQGRRIEIKFPKLKAEAELLQVCRSMASL